MPERVKTYLEINNISYTLHKHEPVFTVEQAKIYCRHIPGMHCKNLFLQDKTKNGYYLILMPAEKKLVINKLAKMIDLKKMSFAPPDELKRIMDLDPGSVSPFGLIHDKGKETTLLIDKEIWDADIVTFHPNVNSETLEIKRDDFRKYVESLGCRYEVLDINFEN
ncbi:MAG: prolyl-tRNA synthetase associated domain-containing protein [Nanoarchaeota archaeon]|nr:prolyl-tRNA synthetase associated domain-containing protein [Nanoarchaeota archaeon]